MTEDIEDITKSAIEHLRGYGKDFSEEMEKYVVDALNRAYQSGRLVGRIK